MPADALLRLMDDYSQVVLRVENARSNATKRGSNANNVSGIDSLVNGRVSPLK
jgi:hypothetical protein